MSDNEEKPARRFGVPPELEGLLDVVPNDIPDQTEYKFSGVGIELDESCCPHLEDGRCNFLDIPAEPGKLPNASQYVCSRQLPRDTPECHIPRLKVQGFTRGYLQLQQLHATAVNVMNGVARNNGCNQCNLGPNGPTCKAVGGDPCLHPEKAEECSVFDIMKARGFTSSGPRDTIEAQQAYDKELSVAQGLEVNRAHPEHFTTLGRKR